MSPIEKIPIYHLPSKDTSDEHKSATTGKAGGLIFPLKADTVQPPKGGAA